MMKKSLWVISMMLGLAVTVGCATKGDLEKVQSNQMQTGAKADQAAQDAQAAKAAADAATIKANEAAARAESAVESAKAAEERANAAEAKATQDQELFKRSMKK
jgi:murein lipoprotein